MELTLLKSGESGCGIYMGDGNDEPLFIGGGITRDDAIADALKNLRETISDLENWKKD